VARSIGPTKFTRNMRVLEFRPGQCKLPNGHN
jgi:hypothetical protein